MPDSPKPTTRVLFVDDDRSFLDMVQRVFGELSQGAWEIHLTTDASAALKLLGQRPMDLAVLDVYMPDVDGLQLLRALTRDHPTLPKVFLTGGADTQTRIAGLEGGAQLFLEKPSNVAGIQTVFATLNELVRWHQKQGARGAPRKAGLLDMVKLECVSGNSRLFEVTSGKTRGVIYIKDGNIIHAETEGRRGQSAFTFLAALSEVEFNLKLFVEPTERSIYRQWEFLFLEAIQLQEQVGQPEVRGREGAPPAARPADATLPRRPDESAPAPTGARPSAPAAPASGAPSVAGPSAPVSPPASAPAPAPSPPSEGEPFRRTPLPELGPLRMMTAAPASRSTGASPREFELPPARPAPARLDLAFDDGDEPLKVEEMLISSSRNEVLHDWQCAETEQRLRLVDQLRRKCEQVAGHLAFGPCDRLEAQAATGRLVVQFQEDAAVWMRSNTRGQRTTSVTLPANPLTPDWLSRHARARGLLAAGVFHVATKVVSLTSSGATPAQNLNLTWRGVSELFDLLEPQSFSAWLIRCLYEQAQLYCVRRDDGLALGVLAARLPQALDLDALNQMFGEFELIDPG